MPVAQLLYGKLPPGESPWKKTGFHTLLYTTDRLSRTEVSAIESALHYPGVANLPTEKPVIFWLTQRGQSFLVTMWVRTLSGERDEFGREGMFLMHAVVHAPEEWQRAGSPLELAWAYQPLVPTSLEGIRQFPGADWATGHLPAPEKQEPAPATGPTTLPPVGLLIAAERQAEGKWTESIVVKGSVADVTTTFDRLYRVLPQLLWPRLACDPVFDSGKLFFFPIKLVGYHQNEPVTGAPVVFDLATRDFRSGQQAADVGQATTVYHQYLAAGHTAQLEKVWQMAQQLDGNPAFKVDPADLPADFFTACADAIRQRFRQLADAPLSAEWMTWLAASTQPLQLLTILLLPPASVKYGKLLWQAMTTAQLSLPAKPLPLPVVYESAALAAWLYLANRPEGQADALSQLQPEDAQALLQLGLAQNVKKEAMLPALARLSPQQLDAFSRDPHWQPLVEAWLMKTLKTRAEFAPIARMLAHCLVQAHRLTAAQLALPEALTLLDTHLPSYGSPDSFVALAKWLKPLAARHTLSVSLMALLKPPASEAALPETIRNQQHLREAYLALLVQVHGYTDAALATMGWPEGEVETARGLRRKPLKERILGFLGLS